MGYPIGMDRQWVEQFVQDVMLRMAGENVSPSTAMSAAASLMNDLAVKLCDKQQPSEIVDTTIFTFRKHTFAEISTILDTGALTQEQLDESLREYIALYGEDLGRAQYEQEYLC